MGTLSGDRQPPLWSILFENVVDLKFQYRGCPLRFLGEELLSRLERFGFECDATRGAQLGKRI